MPEDLNTITPAPAPWTCRATIYTIPLWTSRSAAASPGFGDKAYAPLERGAPFASRAWGEPRGGLSMVQLVRYTDTPVGTYDELILVPGKFAYPAPEGGTKVGLKISRIYVSQKNTCWNGRTNWNIPKQLAHFDWTEHADGSLEFAVYPLGEEAGNAGPTRVPYFQCKFTPLSYAPYFPMSTRVYSVLGIDLALVQPPLPEGGSGASEDATTTARDQSTEAVSSAGGITNELVGTQKWCKSLPYQYSKRACVGWFDLRQPSGDNFWPGAPRWMVGAKMEDTLITLAEGEFWDTPKKAE